MLSNTNHTEEEAENLISSTFIFIEIEKTIIVFPRDLNEKNFEKHSKIQI